MQNNIINTKRSYEWLIAICMLFMSIMLCNAILTNRYVGVDNLYVLGGTFTSPFVFLIVDIVTEIYGFRIAKAMIIYGFLSQTIFVAICQIVLKTPFPTFFHHQESYNKILGSTLLQINFAGCFAYFIASLFNSIVLSRWKVLLKGRYFWLRSLGSSIFSQALYSLFAIIMMEINFLSLSSILTIAGLSFSIKAAYSVIFAFPANMIVNKIKTTTGMDYFDNYNNFTPLYYFNMKKG